MYEDIIEAIEKITQYWQENPPVTDYFTRKPTA